jgi:hypothetical protein
LSSGVSDKDPTKSYVGVFRGDEESERRMSAYGKTGNNAKCGVKMTKSDKLKNPRGGKPILQNDNQQPPAHFPLDEIHGESGI